MFLKSTGHHMTLSAAPPMSLHEHGHCCQSQLLSQLVLLYQGLDTTSTPERMPGSLPWAPNLLHRKDRDAESLWKTHIWKWKCQLLSCIQLFATPWTVACQSLSMEFSRQESWVRLPFLFSRGSSYPRNRTLWVENNYKWLCTVIQMWVWFLSAHPTLKAGTRTPN